MVAAVVHVEDTASQVQVRQCHLLLAIDLPMLWSTYLPIVWYADVAADYLLRSIPPSSHFLSPSLSLRPILTS
ncbi:hypothetical protein K431DRAFT_163120 [Polychaeton citri CBS 116435]|uniref:Uncharacterized protein n=1 Tax=Polychaeton citri CBS 116435 TaxID=1314669 RepID=A0A9P4PY36_9PEZI|nr:hypothetical protein K431DRAFT_163120 [Polychaeton citri CBS 116435]